MVVDDTAVTRSMCTASRRTGNCRSSSRIAKGSLRNKLLFILPAALLLSQFAPWLLTPILMLGATYLCYEGAEKVWGRIRGHEEHTVSFAGTGHEDRRTRRWPARSAPISSCPPRSW